MSEAGTPEVGGFDAARHRGLVDELAGRLTPVRRLPAPTARGALWFAAAVALGLAALPFADMASLRERMGVPDLMLATVGAVMTALAAAVAAFQTSVPGRSPLWAWLPAAPAALWIGASGLGCLRAWVAPGVEPADMREIGGCVTFLLCVSAPLSIALALMLRRACPLRPNLTAALAGLAAAAAAAALLTPFHPHDSTAADLLAHLVIVAAIIAANGLAGGRLLSGSLASKP